MHSGLGHGWPQSLGFRIGQSSEECDVVISLYSADWPFVIFKVLTGEHRPVEVVCKLAHGSDRPGTAHAKTRSHYAETTLTLPWWLIGWDVCCWMGHRRFARHWSVPQIRRELADTSQIPLSADAIEDALQRYQTMLAARQQAPQVLAAVYRTVEALVLSIDG